MFGASDAQGVRRGKEWLKVGSEGWRPVLIPLNCFAGAGANMTRVEPVWSLTASGPFTVSFAEIGLATQAPGWVCPPRAG